MKILDLVLWVVGEILVLYIEYIVVFFRFGLMRVGGVDI